MNIIPFRFQANEIRVIEKDGQPWFVAKDVADLLGYKNPSRSVRDHCKSLILIKTTDSVVLEIPPRGLHIIPERDVYRLVMRSKLPEAQRFEEWVVDEVLPSIRKTGSYSAQPVNLTRMDLIKLAMEAEEENQKLKARVEADTPKVDAYNRIAHADGSMCITDAAKDLQVRPKELFAWLSFHKWIYRRIGNKNWIGYQDKLQRGLLEHKVTTVSRGDGAEKTVEQVRITAKGLTILAEAVQLEVA